jgi:hypothetical protein
MRGHAEETCRIFSVCSFWAVSFPGLHLRAPRGRDKATLEHLLEFAHRAGTATTIVEEDVLKLGEEIGKQLKRSKPGSLIGVLTPELPGADSPVGCRSVVRGQE